MPGNLSRFTLFQFLSTPVEYCHIHVRSFTLQNLTDTCCKSRVQALLCDFFLQRLRNRSPFEIGKKMHLKKMYHDRGAKFEHILNIKHKN